VLEKEDRRAKRGGWYACAIASILDNRKYNGQMEYYFFGIDKLVATKGRHEPIPP